jgi:hypothetical protein
MSVFVVDVTCHADHSCAWEKLNSPLGQSKALLEIFLSADWTMEEVPVQRLVSAHLAQLPRANTNISSSINNSNLLLLLRD